MTQIFFVIMEITDGLMAGNLGPASLGAVSVGYSFSYPILLAIMGISMVLSPVVAQHYGAQTIEKIRISVRHMQYIAVMVSIPVIILLWYSYPLLKYLGIDENILPMAAGYLRARAIGVLPLFLFFTFRYFFEGIGKTQPIMIAAAVGCFANIPLNAIFMYGLFGFPALGAVGTGYATATMEWIMFAMILLHATSKHYYRFNILTGAIRPAWYEFKKLLKLGIPSGVAFAAEVGMFAIIGIFLGKQSVTAISAHQIAINVASFTFMIPMGLSAALASRTGYLIGANASRRDVRFVAILGIISTLAFMLTGAIIIFFMSEAITTAYTSDPAIQWLAVQLLLIVAVFQPADGIQVTLNGLLKGFKDTAVPMAITIVSYWLFGFLPGYYLSTAAGLGATGFWYGILTGLFTASILLAIRYSILINRYPDGRG